LSSYLMYMMLGPVSSGHQHDIQYSPRLLDVILPETSLTQLFYALHNY
jgi:hypothetical protein